MLRSFLALAVCACLPIFALATDGSQPSEKAATPSTELILLDQVVGPLPDDYVFARLDGEPVRLIELLESGGYASRLKEVRAAVPDDQYRSLQESLLERDLKSYLTNRVLVRAFQEGLNAEESAFLAKRFDVIWEEQVAKMIQDINKKFGESLEHREQLEKYLSDHGQRSLEDSRKLFEDRIMVGEFVRRHVNYKEFEGKAQIDQAVTAFTEEIYSNANVRTVLDIEAE